MAVVFMATCVAYVRGLDRLVRASEEAELGRTGVTPRAEVTQ
jgi:hypothetical protein